MSTHPSRRLFTVDAYHSLGEHGIIKENERVELIHGEIIEMAPIGSEHSGMVNRISNLLKLLVGTKAIVAVQNPLYLNDLSEPEPDICVLQPRDDYYGNSHPKPGEVFLIVEVAKSSLDFDRNTKLPLYAAAGIPEYWLVNLQENRIEAHTTPTGNTYRHVEILQAGNVVNFDAFSLQVPVSDLLG